MGMFNFGSEQTFDEFMMLVMVDEMEWSMNFL